MLQSLVIYMGLVALVPLNRLANVLAFVFGQSQNLLIVNCLSGRTGASVTSHVMVASRTEAEL